MIKNLISENRKSAAVHAAVGMMLCLAFLVSCVGSHSTLSGEDGEKIAMHYARLLTIEENQGYTQVTVKNPWDTAHILQRYILVERDSVVPSSLPQGTLVRVPLRNALVYSAVHTGLLTELDAVESIGGVCGAEYINDPELKDRIKSGRISDCGMTQNPDIERVIKLRPEAVLLSPYENNDKYSRIGELGIPVIECADYMEDSPLGRAEWVRFYGLLFGVSDNAERMFASTEREYNRLKDMAADSPERPKVIFDQRYGQAWSVPCSNSTTGKLIVDAGGENPFGKFSRTGSIALAPEKVLGEAHDADVWFVRYNQSGEKTLSELGSDAAVNSQFKAYKEGKVFGCNTARSDLFESTPFHPDRLLRDMVIILHPELMPGEETVYYSPMR